MTFKVRKGHFHLFVHTWRALKDVEFATLEWVSWFDQHRLLAPLEPVPPTEFGQAYHDREPGPDGTDTESPLSCDQASG